ncbi:MAG: DUF434 domain-containing protein [Thermoproteales archaeon]|nr:DUF434 domain-containing protein [Thermoproteales archaeon]
MESCKLFTESFIDACIDYKYLLDRGYYWESALNFVVTRYQLSKIQKNIMLRTIFSENEIKERLAKTVSLNEVRNRILIVDGYNVLATISTAFLKLPLFIGLDGFVRDITSLRRRVIRDQIIYSSLTLLISFVSRISPEKIVFLYDAQVSGSGNLALYTRIMLKRFGLEGKAHTVKRADKSSILHRKKAVVASSDSVVIMFAEEIMDLAKAVIDKYFPMGNIYDLKKIISQHYSRLNNHVMLR